MQVLGLWTFVLEEFGDNVPNYISSLDKATSSDPINQSYTLTSTPTRYIANQPSVHQIACRLLSLGHF